MLNVRNKPYHLLLLTALVLIISSFFLLTGNTTLDIHLHDTYFVLAHAHIFWLLAAVTLFLWTVYLLTGKTLYSKKMIWIHVIITLVTIALIAFLFTTGHTLLNSQPRRYFNYSSWNSFEMYRLYDGILSGSIILLLVGQIVLMINLAAGLSKRR